MYPKISIVTPNYNQADYLEHTIQSVLSQGYPNLEYIIIDGGSTDGSVEIIQKYESQLCYWVSEPDKGMYEAIQKGFDKSTGEIMAWINSDDMYHPKSLFVVAEIFQNHAFVNWLTGTPTLIDEKNRTVYVGKDKKWNKLDFYTNNYMWIQQESTFWSRNLWLKVNTGIFDNLKYAGDFNLWLNFFDYAELYQVSALIGGFRIRESGQLSSLYYKEYLLEVNKCLQNKSLSDLEIKMVNRHNKLKKIINLLQKIKLVNIEYIMNRYYYKSLKYPAVFQFNQKEQCFKYN